MREVPLPSNPRNERGNLPRCMHPRIFPGDCRAVERKERPFNGAQ